MTVRLFFEEYENAIREQFSTALGDIGIAADQLKLVLLDEPYEMSTYRAEFSVTPPHGPVRITWGGIASLWAFCQAVVRLVGEIERETKAGSKILKIEGEAHVGHDLYFLSQRLLSLDMLPRNGKLQWMNWAPRPDPHSSDNYSKMGNLLFLAVISWIMRHEIAHVFLQHSVVVDSIAAENEADRLATLSFKGYRQADRSRALSQQRGTEETELEFRALAVGIGLTWVAEFERAIGSESRTHPPAAERLMRNFRILDLREDSPAEKWISDILNAFDLITKGENGKSEIFQNSSEAFGAALTRLHTESQRK